MEEKRKKEGKKKKENSSELRKPNIEAEVYNNIKSDWIYTYTHKRNQNSPTKIKYSKSTQLTKETKRLRLPEQNELKHKL